MAFVHARMTLPWLAHNGMECICMHTACQPPPYRDTYIHACIEMTTSWHTMNVLMSIFGGGGGGHIDHRVGTAASLLLRVDSWMTDLKAMMVMRICAMRGRRMTYILQMYTQSQRTTGPKQKNEWDQDRSPITENNHSKSALNYCQYHRCLQSQGTTTRLTPVPEELYVALFDVKLQFSKVPLLPVPVM